MRNVRDEPDDDDLEILSVRFRLDSDLEPVWTVVADRDDEGKHIFPSDRSALGVVRLGEWSDRDLAWGRGSALSRMSGSEARPPIAVVAESYRAARDHMTSEQMPELAGTAANVVERAAKQLGVNPRIGFSPRLDVSQLPSRSGSISLHDGHIPLQMAGLGTKRVTSLAIQRESVKEGAIALIDEIEHGLEPFRIRQLIQEFKKMSYDKDSGSHESTDKSSLGQAIITTHSPIALEELNSSEVRITRSINGVTQP